MTELTVGLAALSPPPLDVTTRVLASGGEVWAARSQGADVVELRLDVAMPRFCDLEAAHAEVMAGALLGDRELRRRFHTQGCDATVAVDSRRLRVSVAVPAESWVDVLDLVLRNLAEVSEAGLARGRGSASRRAMATLCHPALVVRAAQHHHIWAERSPSRFDVPTPISLGAVTAETLRAFMRSRVRAAAVRISVCGPHSPNELAERCAEKLELALARESPTDRGVEDPQTLASRAGAGPALVEVPRGAAAIATGHSRLRVMLPSPQRTDPAYAVSRLAAGVMVSGAASRLHRRLRDERALVYSVGHSTETVGEHVFDVLDLDLRREHVPGTVDEIGAAMLEVPRGPEVEGCRRRLVGAQTVARVSSAAVASSLADLAAAGLADTWSDAHVAALCRATVDEVAAHAHHRWRPERAWIAVVHGPVDGKVAVGPAEGEER